MLRAAKMHASGKPLSIARLEKPGKCGRGHERRQIKRLGRVTQR